MAKKYTFISGACTSVSETDESSPGPRKFTYIGGLLTNVSDIDLSLAKSSGNINFINGFATGINATSGSVTPPPPPPSGSPILYMSGSSIQAYVDLTNQPDFIDVDFGDFTWEGWYWPEETTLVDSNYYHGGILIGKSWPGTPISFGWNVGWGLYNGPPYDRKVMFTALGSTTFRFSGVTYLQVSNVANNFGLPYPPIDNTLWLNNWHHVAFTIKHTFSSGYTVATLKTIWLDGIKIAETYYASYNYNYNGETDAHSPIPPSYWPDVHLTAGHQLNPNPNLYFTQMKQGWMRLSNTVRYSISFVPIDRLSPPVSDGNTLGLWYANEGSGSTIINYQGEVNKNGTTHNTTWISS